jgi:hypothetical protein
MSNQQSELRSRGTMQQNTWTMESRNTASGSWSSQNNVADALSWDMGRTDVELTEILFTHVPSQIPSTFKIVPLPNKIVCWVTLLLQKLPVQKRYREVHTKTTLGRGDGGKNIASRQGSEKISSLRNSKKKIEATSSVLLPWLYVKGDLATMLCSLGFRHNQQCHWPRGSNLQESQVPKPVTWWAWKLRLEPLPPIQSIQDFRPEGNSTKSNPF